MPCSPCIVSKLNLSLLSARVKEKRGAWRTPELKQRACKRGGGRCWLLHHKIPLNRIALNRIALNRIALNRQATFALAKLLSADEPAFSAKAVPTALEQGAGACAYAIQAWVLEAVASSKAQERV